VDAVNDASVFPRVLAAYDAYVDGYRDAGGALPEMMRLKREHTRHVVDLSRAIAAGEGFDAPTARACEVAALLHDTGRYEQLRRYDTFRDSESVDHAVLSHAIVREKGWLDGYADRDAVLEAVLLHNRRDVPDVFADARTGAAVRTVRDADKLDIFRVLEERVTETDWRSDARAFWNLATDRPPNPDVVDAILARRPVDYQSIASLCDFVLIQVGWMASGLSYATSRRLCAARGHLAFRRRFLRSLTDSPDIDTLCDFAEARLSEGSPDGGSRKEER
jgi:hypothetical protein